MSDSSSSILSAEERNKSFFITHIGQVIVNDRGTVVFTANVGTPVGLEVRAGQEAKVVVHADTIYEIAREVRAALKQLRQEGTSHVR